MARDYDSPSPERTASPPHYAREDPLTIAHPSPSPSKAKEHGLNGDVQLQRPHPPRRQSSLAQARPKGTPRTVNRVRFKVENLREEWQTNGNSNMQWLSQDDPLEDQDEDSLLNGSTHGQQRRPLLEGVEAPSVRLAEDFDFDAGAEEHLEDARPKSGIKSAFMNMANSIM